MAKEKQVILREMDMNQDDPGQRSARRLFETAYTRSPYRFTVIGYPDIFKQVQREDVLAYYREKYAPNNMFFVVAGDVKPGGGRRPDPSRLRQRQSPAAPAQLSCPKNRARRPPRSRSRKRPSSWAISISAGTSRTSGIPDVPLLDVLATLLGSGRSSPALPAGPRETRGWSIPSTPGPTAPATRACSA